MKINDDDDDSDDSLDHGFAHEERVAHKYKSVIHRLSLSIFYKSFFERGVTMLFTLYTGTKNLSKASGGHHRNRHLTDDDLQARDATIQKIPKTSTTALDVPGPNNNTGRILVNGTLSIYR